MDHPLNQVPECTGQPIPKSHFNNTHWNRTGALKHATRASSLLDPSWVVGLVVDRHTCPPEGFHCGPQNGLLDPSPQPDDLAPVPSPPRHPGSVLVLAILLCRWTLLWWGFTLLFYLMPTSGCCHMARRPCQTGGKPGDVRGCAITTLGVATSTSTVGGLRGIWPESSGSRFPSGLADGNSSEHRCLNRPVSLTLPRG